MNVEIKEQMYEGKAKQVFATSDPEIVMVHYKDDATAGDGEKKGTIRDKGIVNNKLSNALMQKLEKEGIPTHYVEELNDRDTLVKKVQIVPLEVIIRNMVRVLFLRPKERPYRTNNFYAVLERQDNLDKEVYRIVHPSQKARTEKSGAGRYLKGKAHR